ncbi:hypothetical protein G6O69_30930 [Pseudenhygromyxa sp. WMMC2535]|uniref:hypothetical protein n=1 Tax=Pseudenhygromyxa sp. WMMC2535 TaxID=2712867 RepID=UPI001555C0EF|nr:hypothetical protein [Pseudenhygromyxa sp. WMMC2535]NVB42279.1 hypothetical protein [Pseudenhygromyxa sp. WMMC2535]
MSAVLTWLRRVSAEPALRRRALLFVLTLALSFVPMAGTLGYFSGLILAPILSLLAAAAGVDAVRAVRERAPQGTIGRDVLWQVAGLAGRDLAWLVGIALGVLTLGALWNRNCDLLGGALYFLLGPALSGLLGLSAGIVGGVVVGDQRERRTQLLVAWVPFAFCVVVGLARLYFAPVVYAYDPFFGWYAGPIYDESIAIGPRYLLFRAYNLLVAGGAWSLLRAGVNGQLRLRLRWLLVDARARARTLLAALLLLVGGAVGLSGARWGFTANRESIAAVLSATYETEHFVIHYVPTSLTAREIVMVAAEHEFAWHDLEAKLGVAPTRKVESFVFENGKQRQGLLGADRVEVAPPWRQQMYLSHRIWPHPVMPHELGHAFMGDVGDPVFGLPLNRRGFNGALVEGVPTALAPRPADNLGPHEQAAILDRLDKRPPLAAIMGAGFYGAAASRAYTAAGSFVLWLAQTRGWAVVAELYANAGDFQASTGEDLVTLEAQWLRFLRGIELRQQDIDAQAQRFERASVFRRPCAHRVARLRVEAARARLQEDRGQALAAQRTLCSIEPEYPAHVLGLAEMLAQWGAVDEAAQALDALAARDELTSPLRAKIEEQRGDTALLAGELELAGQHYRAALAFGLSEAARRVLQIKLRASEDPALAREVLDYFGPFELEPKTTAYAVDRLWTALRIRELPGHFTLGRYLVARQLLNYAAPAQALEVLAAESAGEPELWTTELRRADAWARVSALVQTGRWAEAQAVLDRLEVLAEGEGHRMEVEQWRARIDFFRGWFAAQNVELPGERGRHGGGRALD